MVCAVKARFLLSLYLSRQKFAKGLLILRKDIVDVTLGCGRGRACLYIPCLTEHTAYTLYR